MILCILNYQLNYFIKYIYNINILIFQQNIYHKNTKHRVKSRIKTKEYQQKKQNSFSMYKYFIEWLDSILYYIEWLIFHKFIK